MHHFHSIVTSFDLHEKRFVFREGPPEKFPNNSGKKGKNPDKKEEAKKDDVKNKYNKFDMQIDEETQKIIDEEEQKSKEAGKKEKVAAREEALKMQPAKLDEYLKAPTLLKMAQEAQGYDEIKGILNHKNCDETVVRFLGEHKDPVVREITIHYVSMDWPKDLVEKFSRDQNKDVRIALIKRLRETPGNAHEFREIGGTMIHDSDAQIRAWAIHLYSYDSDSMQDKEPVVRRAVAAACNNIEDFGLMVKSLWLK